jgi:hypothetical protein
LLVKEVFHVTTLTVELFGVVSQMRKLLFQFLLMQKDMGDDEKIMVIYFCIIWFSSGVGSTNDNIKDLLLASHDEFGKMEGTRGSTKMLNVLNANFLSLVPTT